MRLFGSQEGAVRLPTSTCWIRETDRAAVIMHFPKGVYDDEDDYFVSDWIDSLESSGIEILFILFFSAISIRCPSPFSLSAVLPFCHCPRPIMPIVVMPSSHRDLLLVTFFFFFFSVCASDFESSHSLFDEWPRGFLLRLRGLPVVWCACVNSA
jgi:hypothetical protein